MKLEEQVCSLPLAKKLWEIGVRQYSLWDWLDGELGRISNGKFWLGLMNGRPLKETDVYYPAFTVAELGEMLPADFTAEKQEDGWNGGYCGTIGREIDTEANLRADILAALIERGIVDVESLVDPEIQFMLGEKR